MAGFGQARRDAYDRSARSEHWRSTFAGLTAFERHQRLLRQLGAYDGAGGQEQGGADDPAAALAGIRTDADVLRQSYRFIRRPEDDARDSWEVRLARRYYGRLFREYAIIDLSRYREQKVGLRWRTEAEVASGKGQFVCGARGCGAREGLASFELLFRYQEAGEAKAALVKVRCCPDCAAKLNYGRSSEARYRPKGGGGGGDGRRGRSRSRSRSKGRRRGRRSGGDGDGSGSEGGGSEGDRRRRRKRRHSKKHRGSDDDDEERRGGGGGSGGKQQRGRSRSRSRSRSRGRQRGPGSGGRHRERSGPGEGAAAAVAEAGQGPSDADIERWLDDVFAE